MNTKGRVVKVEGTYITINTEPDIRNRAVNTEKGTERVNFPAWEKPEKMPAIGTIIRLHWKGE